MTTPKGPDKTEWACPKCDRVKDFCDCPSTVAEFIEPPAQVGGRDEMRILYASGRGHGQAMQQAQDLARRIVEGLAKKVTIEVVSEETIQLRETVARLEGLNGAMNSVHAHDVAVNERLERELAEAKEIASRHYDNCNIKNHEIMKLRAENKELRAEMDAVKTGKGIANPYLIKDQLIKMLKADLHAARYTISETQGALNRANEEIAKLQSELKHCADNYKDLGNVTFERIASLEKALEKIATDANLPSDFDKTAHVVMLASITKFAREALAKGKK